MPHNHTSGPWQIKESGPAPRYIIAVKDGESIACTYGQEKQASDAQLIAAAPDMLATLEYVLLADRFDGALTLGTAALSPAIRDKIKRTIAQAKGEPDQ